MIYFVGAGPGDVDLITVKGRRILEAADVVIYAGSLVWEEHLKFCKDDFEKYNSASMTLEEVISVMVSDKIIAVIKCCKTSYWRSLNLWSNKRANG